MKNHSLHPLTISLTLLTSVALSPNLHAGWGSIQGSNHSAAPARSSAPRPQPSRPSQPTHAPEPSHAPEPARQPEPARPPEAYHAPEPTRAPESHPEKPAPERPMAGERPPAHNEVVRTPEGETDRRRMDIDNERRQSYFWSDYHRGMHIDRLPDGYRHIGVRGHDYCYFDGVYYDNGPEGYIVVAPPLDADISDLPPGAETVEDASGNIYYYAGGAFYVQSADGSYVVVAPPMGVTVTLPPPDAVVVVINGVQFYQSDGTFYEPVMQNGVTAYLTVPQPQ